MSRGKPERELIATLFHLCIRHWKLAVLFVIVSMMATTALHYKFPMYQASSSLYIKSVETSPILSATARISGYQVRDYSMKALNTGYLQILQAENLGEFVAQRFNDNPDLLEDLTIDFHDEFGRNSNPGDAVDKNKQIAEALVGSTRFTPR
ncbi:MAG: hypothetical protein AB7P49_02525, partial [Bdellovibrionales bacterium]